MALVKTAFSFDIFYTSGTVSGKFFYPSLQIWMSIENSNICTPKLNLLSLTCSNCSPLLSWWQFHLYSCSGQNLRAVLPLKQVEMPLSRALNLRKVKMTHLSGAHTPGTQNSKYPSLNGLDGSNECILSPVCALVCAGMDRFWTCRLGCAHKCAGGPLPYNLEPGKGKERWWDVSRGSALLASNVLELASKTLKFKPGIPGT